MAKKNINYILEKIVVLKFLIFVKEINSMNYKIRSVCTNDEGDILIGTRGGEILEIEDNVPKICFEIIHS